MADPQRPTSRGSSRQGVAPERTQPPALPRTLHQVLRQSALRCLSQREHSRSELRARLLRNEARRESARARRDAGADAALSGAAAGASALDDLAPCAPATEPAESRTAAKAHLAAAVDAVLDQLSQQGLLSDQRFLESRVHARSAQWGERRIAHELQQHGVVLDANTRAQLQGSELTRALALWQRRFGTPAEDASARLRQMRFLAGRGFSGDVIRRIVQGPRGLDEAIDLDTDMP